MSVRTFGIQTGCTVLACAVLAALSGCGGGGFGSELEARPTPRPLDTGQNATLCLPQDEPFSIALAPKQAAPGLSGSADAVSNVSKQGHADATARVENGGSATASFQLGHALKNDSDGLVSLRLRVQCEYDISAEATPPSPSADAKVELNLYARDGRNRLVRSLNLAQHTTAEGAASSRDRKDIEFTLPLGARESLNIFLAGGVEIETPEGRAARGTIKLDKLEMEIATEAAPPVRKAGDGQG
jgi:hypothetical protein